MRGDRGESESEREREKVDSIVRSKVAESGWIYSPKLEPKKNVISHQLQLEQVLKMTGEFPPTTSAGPKHSPDSLARLSTQIIGQHDCTAIPIHQSQ